ncbi:DUF4097 family beta strand repeat-containing protein [Aliikangiella sp. G2MR2-5]|uniref:DUF4097 family beta strand repeat-containing protein n=1 Tax=Aliikangiella sp. G2MR2-5 TaxID=2788943 RepID=UPI0018ABBCAB|nr:DUF4097 family beta strand repeat-containing protein [Aliikangiella sp. G2MR2-5]
MKYLTPLLALSLSFSVFAGEKVDKSLDVEANGQVEINNTRGEITVKGWDKNQVRVKGTLDDLTEKFIFETSGDKTTIKVKLPRNTGHRSHDGSKLEVWLPQSSSMSFTGVATDLKVEKVEGGVEINSVSGDLKISQIKKRTYVNNVSGDIDANEIEGKFEISTVSGDLKAKISASQISVSGVSADLDINAASFERVKASTVSGSIKLKGQMLANGEIKMSSVSGDAYYYFTDNFDAKVSLETAPGGRVVNEFNDVEPQTSFIDSQSLAFTSGEGSGVIRMSTVSGDIGLKSGK